MLCGKREDDALFRPNGYGEKIVNPWSALEAYHTEYMSGDYNEIKATLTYPRPASMSWFGIETGGHFLYIGRHDERCRACCLLSAIQGREAKEPRLVSSICQYPFVKREESISCAPVVVALKEGDWRTGSDIYGEWARGSFYKPVTPQKWVTIMTGWQRVILRHQYGEIFWKYKDLPRLYLEGKKYGLDTVFVFGWWAGRAWGAPGKGEIRGLPEGKISRAADNAIVRREGNLSRAIGGRQRRLTSKANGPPMHTDKHR
jgi:hypothetical protein